MEKKVFFLAVTLTFLFSNCSKENVKRERVGGSTIIIYDQASVSLFTKQSLLPSCIDGVKKAGASNVVSTHGGSADGLTGQLATSTTTKECRAEGVE
ncbi:MAG: hypothetical protein OEV66_01970 [Spirochaetia bacterium]|nr:hypothetical protein [Spirochaetia bacterium]